MKVILLKDVRSLGAAHEVKEVANGYALNFLLPRKLAEIATDDKVKILEEKTAARAAERAAREEELDHKIAVLNGKKITMVVRAAPTGGLFRSVSAEDVVKNVRLEHSLEIPESSVKLGEPIKSIGEYEIKLSGKSQHATLHLALTPSA